MEKSNRALTPRQQARQNTEAEVLKMACSLLDTHGVSGLSLREISRELGMVSSALYRYVKNRDELLTLVIRSSFSALADEVESRQMEGVSNLQSISLAMLQWSRCFPHRWALLYGTPQENYQAPAEATTEPGTRIMKRVALAVIELSPVTTNKADIFEGSDDKGTTQGMLSLQAELNELGVQASYSQTLKSLVAWTSIIGMINSLRFGHLGPGLELAEEELLEEQVRWLETQLSI